MTAASNHKAEPVATSAVTLDATCSKNAGGLIENEWEMLCLCCGASMVPSQEVSLLSSHFVL